MSNDSLGDRMKNKYEDAYRIHLPGRMPTIIRVDGKAFHTLTSRMKKPWDPDMLFAMQQTALELAKKVAGCKLAYVQSDEISLLLTDYDTLNTEAWFQKNLQKMVSVTASIASIAFTREIQKGYPGLEGLFDARAFVLPKEEVCNYYIWRQADAVRNSIQGLAQANFSHKSLQGLSCNQLQEKLFQDKGINWNDTATYKKRGACAFRGTGVDLDIPDFKTDRNYIEKHLLTVEEAAQS